MTHAVAGTTDIIYGCDQDIALDDEESAANADNYNVSKFKSLTSYRVLIKCYC